MSQVPTAQRTQMVSLRVPAEIIDRLDLIAVEHGVTRTVVIMDAVKKSLGLPDWRANVFAERVAEETE